MIIACRQVWDVFFAAVMLGLAGPGHARARDIAYANVITTVYSRTTTGMVPNYRNGQGGATCTYDRTEPMVGSWSLQILHSVFGDDWIVELVRDAHGPSHRRDPTDQGVAFSSSRRCSAGTSGCGSVEPLRAAWVKGSRAGRQR